MRENAHPENGPLDRSRGRDRPTRSCNRLKTLRHPRNYADRGCLGVGDLRTSNHFFELELSESPSLAGMELQDAMARTRASSAPPGRERFLELPVSGNASNPPCTWRGPCNGPGLPHGDPRVQLEPHHASSRRELTPFQLHILAGSTPLQKRAFTNYAVFDKGDVRSGPRDPYRRGEGVTDLRIHSKNPLLATSPP